MSVVLVDPIWELNFVAVFYKLKRIFKICRQHKVGKLKIKTGLYKPHLNLSLN
jgi:hypothetical protein